MGVEAPNLPGTTTKRIEKLEELLERVAKARGLHAEATKELEDANKEAKKYVKRYEVPIYRHAGLVIKQEESIEPDELENIRIISAPKERAERKKDKEKAEKEEKGGK